jgi:hypothetical protein
MCSLKAWCVRTILIARSAEQHIPRLAASALAEFSGLKALGTLIARKDDPVVAQEPSRARWCSSRSA